MAVTMKPRDEAQSNHDLVVLLTQVNIFATKTSGRGMVGAGYTAQACNATWSCVICKDTGMDLGGTVAHDIGHLMGSVGKTAG
jgi:thrombospondin motif-containing protein 13